ncbi:hypothetical protein NH288_08620 [Anaerococcus sp. NML200537]|uniref:hypothetical protein n=1 Tax=Anaerococcus sp. NML200537 TaxID=2954485 RepID=UPI002237C211|nr:hypothetical protein [Anaerococcus sp. NML200537]MCW6702149.1 hypothetical protein [Anaerococcus sp. NML200537]
MKETLGIDEKLNRLLKNVGADYFSKKEVEDEDYVSEDELEKSEETDNDDEIVYDFSNASENEDGTEVDETIEDEELEKAEEDEIADEEVEEPTEDMADEVVEDEPEQAPEEEAEEEEGVEEVDYDDLLGRINEDLGLDEINVRLDDLTANIEKIVNLLEVNADNTAEVANKSDELEKSLARITKSINKTSNLRKSIKNAKTINKFEEERKTYKDLSKSERANILSNELIAGHRNVTALDVTKAEQGAPLNEACIAIIEKHIKEERI